MFVGARVSQWTVPFPEGLAVWTRWIEAEAILPLQKVGKGKVVLGLGLSWLEMLGDGVRLQRCGRAVVEGDRHQQWAARRESRWKGNRSSDVVVRLGVVHG